MELDTTTDPDEKLARLVDDHLSAGPPVPEVASLVQKALQQRLQAGERIREALKGREPLFGPEAIWDGPPTT